VVPPSPNWVEAFGQRRGFADHAPWRLRNQPANWMVSNEHLRRFSARLLASIHTILSLGDFTWGEALAPSVCHAMPSMRCVREAPAGFPDFLTSTSLALESLPMQSWYHVSSVFDAAEAAEADGLCIVKDMAQVEGFTPAPEVIARGLELNGLKVFIPKTFFHEDLLPRNHERMFGFIAKVISDTQFGHYGPQFWPLVDPAKMVRFNDGAEVPFYIKRHGRARRATKHVHLSNETVRFLVPKVYRQSTAAQTADQIARTRTRAQLYLARRGQVDGAAQIAHR